MEFTRESIFGGAVRSFCKSVAIILGVALGFGIVGIGLAVITGPNFLPPKPETLIMPDAAGNRMMLPASAPALLRLDFHGVIGIGDLTSEKMINVLLDSQEDFLKGGRVKGVLLHLDTPGGAASDADTIYRILMAYKQKYNIPIHAYVDGLCASGGMYIACAADKIFASPSSIIGSVGVRMGPNFNFADAMTKYGVAALTLTQGKDKDSLNPFRPWTPDEGAPLQPIMAALYDRFVSIVAAARPMLTKDKLINEYGAHVFIAQEAEKLGYVDSGHSDYSEAVQMLASAAKIDEKEHYQVVQLTPPHPFFSNLAQTIAPMKAFRGALGLGSSDMSELSGKFLYYYQPSG